MSKSVHDATSRAVLLTIAIPTYNRAEYLDTNLARLNEELNSLDREMIGLIKVFISNNASTDDTEQVISKYEFYGIGELEVVTNSTNIGAENNVIQCYESARSPYVWILGDDDVVLNGGLNKVLTVLQSKQPDILYLGNYHFLDSYLDRDFAHNEVKPAISNYESSLVFAKKVNVMLTFISALVVRSSEYVDYNKGGMPGSYLSQLTWVLPLLRDGGRFSIVNTWVVAAKGGNGGGYALIKVFGENLKSILNRFLVNKPKEAAAIINGTIINFFPGFILEIRKGKSRFNNEDLEKGLARLFSSNWRYYFFLLPLIKLPLFLACRYNNGLNILRRFVGNYLI